ncbi:MAG: hypothetical protein RL641_767 [Candidatus Parcubacteria bacterium]|jgi:hypothetical protein
MSSQKKPFVSDKLAKHRKNVARARRILMFIILALILGGASFFTYANTFQIHTVLVNGAKAVSPDEIKLAAENGISGNNVIVPNRNVFLYPRNALKASIASAFPRLDTIAVDVKNEVLLITVTEREPAYLWCGESIPTNRQESFASACYFVDAKGFIFSTAPQFSDAVYSKIYTTLANATEPVGQFAMDADVLARVSLFAKEIETPTFKPSAFSVTADGDALIFLYRDSAVMPEVRLNPKHDALTDVAGFKTAVSSEPLKSKLTKSFANLEYIDVRFANKVFYKFHDEANTQQADESKKQ